MKAAHPHTDCRGVSEVIGPLAPQIVPKSLKKVHINQLLRMSDLRGLGDAENNCGQRLLKSAGLGKNITIYRAS